MLPDFDECFTREGEDHEQFCVLFLYIAAAFIPSSQNLENYAENGTLVKTKSKNQDNVLS